MGSNDFEWDFFIAHAGPDRELAEKLHALLKAAKARVCLPTKSLQSNEDWAFELAKAQSSSLVTIVLISVRTDIDFYNRKDVAAAIALASAYDKRQRVAPIYLSSAAMSGSVPSGLRLKHGVTLSREPILTDIVARLLDQLAQIQSGSQPVVQELPNDPTSTIDDKFGNAENSLLRYELSKEERKALNEALLSAYPKLDVLAQMVGLELGENLDAIVEKGTLKNTIFMLVGWAESTGHLNALVRGAHQYNRGNPKLDAFYKKFMTP